jgi:LuxR family maltose regulon positive regulatory protein
MSEVHREHNDLVAAKRCLWSSHDLGEHTGLPQNRYRWRVSMARVHEAEGDLGAALALLEEAERTYIGDFAPEVRPVSALKARVWVRQGRLTDAFTWAEQRGLSVEDELSYLREFQHVSLARMLTARFASDRSERDLADATRLLERLLGAAVAGGRTGSVLEVLVLQALVGQLNGDTALALATLHRALELAAPEDYARIFLDEGPVMTTLLHAAADHGLAPTYVGRLLGAGAVEKQIERRTPTDGGPLIEPLSERERDVLRLLATDLSGPDIARELVVSLSTVRTHTRSIYAKLGVTSRRAAVRRSGELDLLGTSRRPR